jgi:hypothetical protein
MVKKKKAKRSAPKKNKQSTKLPLPQTQFMSQFRGLLKSPSQQFWPPKDQLPGQSFTDIAGVVSLLGNAYVTSSPPAPGAGTDIVSKAATLASAYPWPTNAVYAGKKYYWRATTMNLYEISRIVDFMLQALNRGAAGSGGGGTGWPPSK